MSDDSVFEVETKITRGTSTDDRDTIKAKVEADSLDELNEKLTDVRDQLEDHADLVRSIQPDSKNGGHRVTDDQATLGEESGSA